MPFRHPTLTSEHAFLHRREFLLDLARSGLFILPTLAGCSPERTRTSATGYPAPRAAEYDPGLRLTNPSKAAHYNNFFEFSASKSKVRELADQMPLSPWPITIGGLVEYPQTLEAEELVSLFALEERVYRFRCVEAWAMVVPWTGFGLAHLLRAAKPLAEARYVRFEGMARAKFAPGMSAFNNYPWPYTEALRLDEAMHPLAFLATGIYGRPLPPQHGAPARLVVPWKYGFKSIKSITRIDLTATAPQAFWPALVPAEYTFEANVDPLVPHPRWSQATEVMIDTGDRVPSRRFNGYGPQVAALYASA